MDFLKWFRLSPKKFLSVAIANTQPPSDISTRWYVPCRNRKKIENISNAGSVSFKGFIENKWKYARHAGGLKPQSQLHRAM